MTCLRGGLYANYVPGLNGPSGVILPWKASSGPECQEDPRPLETVMLRDWYTEGRTNLVNCCIRCIDCVTAV